MLPLLNLSFHSLGQLNGVFKYSTADYQIQIPKVRILQGLAWEQRNKD